jgi:hypothetical protein
MLYADQRSTRRRGLRRYLAREANKRPAARERSAVLGCEDGGRGGAAQGRGRGGRRGKQGGAAAVLAVCAELGEELVADVGSKERGGVWRARARRATGSGSRAGGADGV